MRPGIEESPLSSQAILPLNSVISAISVKRIIYPQITQINADFFLLLASNLPPRMMRMNADFLLVFLWTCRYIGIEPVGPDKPLGGNV